MREIVPFCEEHDTEQPDFLEMCLSERRIVRPHAINLEQLDEKNQKIVDDRRQEYYEKNWSKVIMRIMRYKNPLIANVHMMTQLTTEIDPGTKVYFHIGWLKPGRHTFLIKHDNNDIKLNDSDDEKK